jgi:hypothetical protein
MVQQVGDLPVLEQFGAVFGADPDATRPILDHAEAEFVQSPSRRDDVGRGPQRAAKPFEFRDGRNRREKCPEYRVASDGPHRVQCLHHALKGHVLMHERIECRIPGIRQSIREFRVTGQTTRARRD